MSVVIGIDLGTTSISGVVLDIEEKRLLEKKTISGGRFLQGCADWEKIQDAEEIVTKAQQVIDEFLVTYKEIEEIGIDCQMHGMVYLGVDGALLSPLYIWQDGRGEVRDANGKTAVEEILEVSGEMASSGYGLVTHFYNKKHHLVPKGAKVICTIGDYLAMRLTGRTAPVMHTSNAASFGFFDKRQGCFDWKKLQMAGIDREILPEVVQGIEILGEYKGRPVSVAIGDNQASFLGAVGLESRKLLVNVGTGSQISILTEEYVEIPGMETRPIMENKWLLVGASLCGGRAYALVETFFRSYVQAERQWKQSIEGTDEQDGKQVELTGETIEKQYPIMEKLAGEALKKREFFQYGRNQGMQVQTLFSGTRENPEKLGSISGISTENFTPGEMILGTMEGMVQELYEMYHSFADRKDSTAEEIVLSGNGVRQNQILEKAIAERFSLPYRFSMFEEEAACGAALSVWIDKNQNE